MPVKDKLPAVKVIVVWGEAPNKALADQTGVPGNETFRILLKLKFSHHKNHLQKKFSFVVLIFHAQYSIVHIIISLGK